MFLITHLYRIVTVEHDRVNPGEMNIEPIFQILFVPFGHIYVQSADVSALSAQFWTQS